jgi:Domain of unknown function (DUF4270)
MMIKKKDSLLILLSAGISLGVFVSCNKTTIDFGSDGTAGDPNISMIDTFSVELATLQADSFLTNASQHFVVGSHNDPQLGKTAVKSYFELTAPALDLRDCSNCSFDSIDIRLKVSAGYAGDTSVPFTINLYEVTQAMDETESSVGYNVSSFPYHNTPIATKTFMIRPSRKEEISIRLPDEFGSNFFRMLRANSDTLTNDTRFKRYLKGLCLETASSNNAVFYFDKDPGDSILQVHYKETGTFPISKTAYFSVSATDHQFNAYTYDKSGTAVAAFTPKRKQLINSNLTGNTAFVHSNSGLYPKIKFNHLYHIKELHPFVQVLRAELEIKPVANSYQPHTLYPLPASIEMRVVDNANNIGGTAVSTSNGVDVITQTGSLFVDNIYGENTSYTYDVTGFVNSVISAGLFSEYALLMVPSGDFSSASDQRLLIGTSHSGGSIKLKLYILGL